MTGAIVFDLDGTLIDSAPDIHAATNALLAEDGLPLLTFAQVRGFIGAGVPVLITRILTALGEDPKGPRHADLVRRFETRYETAHGLTRLYPGVIAALEALQGAGHPLGLCTNKPIGPTRTALDHFGLTRFFSVVIGGDSLTVRKPDPAPLLSAFAELGSNLLFVGDSEVDTETALRAGARFALFTQGYRATDLKDLPHWRAFDDFSALPGIVAELV